MMFHLVGYVSLVIYLFAGSVFAGEENKGFEIAARADRSDLGFSSSKAHILMIVTDKRGRSRKRNLILKTLERDNDQQGDRTLIVFRSPADIARTALLSHAQLLDHDDQWLFLPRLGRVKRISGANKSGAFVGTEFSFEDLTAQELHKFSYEWLRADSLDGVAVDVVERIPRYRRSAYSRQEVWYARSHGQPLRIDSFGKNKVLGKRLMFQDYRKVSNFWRAHHLRMENLLTNRSTTLEFNNYEIAVGYNASDFERVVLDAM